MRTVVMDLTRVYWYTGRKTRRPPVEMWANALRWGMSPIKVLEAIQGWVEAH